MGNGWDEGREPHSSRTDTNTRTRLPPLSPIPEYSGRRSTFPAEKPDQ